MAKNVHIIPNVFEFSHVFRLLPNLQGHLKFFCGARGQIPHAWTCLTLSSHMSYDFAQLFTHSSQRTFDSSTMTLDFWDDCVTRWEHSKLFWEHSTSTWEQSQIIWEQSNHIWGDSVHIWEYTVNFWDQSFVICDLFVENTNSGSYDWWLCTLSFFLSLVLRSLPLVCKFL